MLSVKGVNKKIYKSWRDRSPFALKNLNFELASGSLNVLVGPNGAGKTSTLKTILGLIKPDSGKILFQGKKIDTKGRALIGYMPETSKLFASLTPKEHLFFHCSHYDLKLSSKEIQEKIEATLDTLSLSKNLWDVPVKSLSKGSKKKLAWAQAFLPEPLLYVLDEPFSGLDPKSKDQMLEWICSYKGSHNCFLVCTHDYEDILNECDQVLSINNGLVQSKIKGKDLFSSYAVAVPIGFETKVKEEGSFVVQENFHKDQNKLVLYFDTYKKAISFVTFVLKEESKIIFFKEKFLKDYESKTRREKL